VLRIGPHAISLLCCVDLTRTEGVLCAAVTHFVQNSMTCCGKLCRKSVCQSYSCRFTVVPRTVGLLPA
jgi:hypothetical protein